MTRARTNWGRVKTGGDFGRLRIKVGQRRWPTSGPMSLYNLTNIGQVSRDVWFEMYNGVHGRDVDVERAFGYAYRFATAEPYCAAFNEVGSASNLYRRGREEVALDPLRGLLLPQVDYVHRDDFEDTTKEVWDD